MYSISFILDGVSKMAWHLTKGEKDMMLEALTEFAINNYHRVSNVTIHKTL